MRKLFGWVKDPSLLYSNENLQNYGSAVMGQNLVLDLKYYRNMSENLQIVVDVTIIRI